MSAAREHFNTLLGELRAESERRRKAGTLAGFYAPFEEINRWEGRRLAELSAAPL